MRYGMIERNTAIGGGAKSPAVRSKAEDDGSSNDS